MFIKMEVRDSTHLLCVSLAPPGWPATAVRAAERSDWFGGLPALSEEGRTASFKPGAPRFSALRS